MRDLRIVIVSWNSEQQLAACLSSLPAACEGLTWEVVVVDNASRDKSVEMAQRHVGTHGQVIVNKDNRGFAKACNQGIAGFESRYVLLLNPDTECPKGSLTRLVRAAESRPDVGIVGPKLLNTDGSAQTSIRRFPDFWSQAGVLLKLHNVFPELFTRYFAADLSLEKEQHVDSVMGACFLVRRECLKDIGALDERYFIWFEEVDYCRAARAHGWKVCYFPDIAVMHTGGQSFDQVFSVKKQKYFNASLIAYFQKWHGDGVATVLKTLQPVSLGFTWMISKFGLAGRGSKTVLSRDTSRRGSLLSDLRGWVFALLALYGVSALTIFHPVANTVACVLVGLLMLIVTLRRPTIGLAAIALELLIGSQGHLLQIGKGFISLRSMLFVAFMLGWAVQFVRRGSFQYVRKLFRGREEWLALGAITVVAFVRGIGMNNAPIIADANAWVFAALILPVLDLAVREGERLKSDILPVLIIGPLWAAAQTLGLGALYAHSLAIVDPPSAIHLWVRRTGLAEVTPIGRVAHRIFMASFVFGLPALLLWLSERFTTQGKGSSRINVLDVLMSASIITMALGLSRSLWIGAFVGVVTVGGLHLWKDYRSVSSKIVPTIGRAMLIVLISLVLVEATRVQMQSPTDARSATSTRLTVTDAASNSRVALLNAMMSKISEHPILGSGFGATVTYKSADPRVLAVHPDGMYTTYAFEWGWLEHWIKFGIIGFFLMIFLVCRLGWRVWETQAEDWIKYAMLGSLAAIAVTHVFTPYLNHPLGFGYLLALEVWTIIAARIPASRASMLTTG